jgi:hypothetical protein
MEALWISQRAALRCLVRQHPDWTQAELAAAIRRACANHSHGVETRASDSISTLAARGTRNPRSSIQV